MEQDYTIFLKYRENQYKYIFFNMFCLHWINECSLLVLLLIGHRQNKLQETLIIFTFEVEHDVI